MLLALPALRSEHVAVVRCIDEHRVLHQTLFIEDIAQARQLIVKGRYVSIVTRQVVTVWVGTVGTHLDLARRIQIAVSGRHRLVGIVRRSP